MGTRVAVITGGAQGIGKAIAHQFLQNGYSVVIADTDGEAGRETALDYAARGSLQPEPTSWLMAE